MSLASSEHPFLLRKKRKQLRAVEPTQAALCCSVACWYVSYLSSPPALSVVPLPADLTDKASVTAPVTFTVNPPRHHRSAATCITYQVGLHTLPSVLHSQCEEGVRWESEMKRVFSLIIIIMQQYYRKAKRLQLYDKNVSRAELSLFIVVVFLKIVHAVGTPVCLPAAEVFKL